MNKANLKEALNATAYGLSIVNKEIINVLKEYGPEGFQFAKGKRPYGMFHDRSEFEMTAIRYNADEECLEAKDGGDDWFPVYTSLVYDNFIEPLELGDFILAQD